MFVATIVVATLVTTNLRVGWTGNDINTAISHNKTRLLHLFWSNVAGPVLVPRPVLASRCTDKTIRCCFRDHELKCCTPHGENQEMPHDDDAPMKTQRIRHQLNHPRPQAFLPHWTNSILQQLKRKFRKTAGALFRISWKTNSFEYQARRFVLPVPDTQNWVVSNFQWILFFKLSGNTKRFTFVSLAFFRFTTLFHKSMCSKNCFLLTFLEAP